MNIILLGLPGAGKGTQAKLIMDHLQIPHISTGDLFRKAVQQHSPLGIKAKVFMDRGELVPDEITIGIAVERLAEPDCRNGFLLDGFPRNLNQAQALKNDLAANQSAIDHVIYVKVDESLLLERLTGRRVCGRCGSTYHMLYHPPAVEGRCDACGDAVIQRNDDREHTVRERLNINKELTEQLVDYYAAEGSLRTIDGSREIGKITEELVQILDLK